MLRSGDTHIDQSRYLAWPWATLITQPGPALLHFALPPPSRRGAEVAMATSCLKLEEVLEMLRAGVKFAATSASRIEEAIYMVGRVFPSIRWMKYAALRLGTFIMSYFSIVAAIVLGLALAGVGIGIGLVLALVPVAVFIAIRISGALTENRNPGR